MALQQITLPAIGQPGSDTRHGAFTKSNANFSETETRLGVLETAVVAVNLQTATPYTLVLADAGKIVEMNLAGANTLTIPTNATVAFPIGTLIQVDQVGAGTTTIAGAGGVTLRPSGTLTLRAQWSSASLRKRGTDEWVVSGDLT